MHGTGTTAGEKGKGRDHIHHSPARYAHRHALRHTATPSRPQTDPNTRTRAHRQRDVAFGRGRPVLRLQQGLGGQTPRAACQQPGDHGTCRAQPGRSPNSGGPCRLRRCPLLIRKCCLEAGAPLALAMHHHVEIAALRSGTCKRATYTCREAATDVLHSFGGSCAPLRLPSPKPPHRSQVGSSRPRRP